MKSSDNMLVEALVCWITAVLLLSIGAYAGVDGLLILLPSIVLFLTLTVVREVMAILLKVKEWSIRR